MRLLRIRLWMLLLAVAIVGPALGGWPMWRRREACPSRARSLDRDIAITEGLARQAEADQVEWLIRATRARNVRDIPRRDRYLHVARFPWLPMPRETK